jgi:hypothetical protein
MNIGKLLGGLSPGLSATGLFGHGAQSTGTAMLSGMSPLLALLLHKKGGGQGAPQAQTPAYTPPETGSVLNTPQPLAQVGGPSIGQLANSLPGMADPHAQRKAIGLNLLQLGPQLAQYGYPRY